MVSIRAVFERERTVADILNLNKARKRKAKAEAGQRAQQNRILHGRTKAEKQLQAALDAEAQRKLDGLKLDEPDHP